MAAEFLRCAAFEVRTKRGPRGRLRVLIALWFVTSVLIWRNVSYAEESLASSSLHPTAGLPALLREAEQGRGAFSAMTQADRQAHVRGIRAQLVSDRFDYERSTVPGAIEVALGFGAGAAGVLFGFLLAAVVVGFDLRHRTLFFPAVWGRSRSAVVLGKLAAVPPLSAGIVLALAGGGLLAGAVWNWVYRGDPLFGWARPGVAPHLLWLGLSALAVVSIWGTIAVAASLAARSTLSGFLVVASLLALDTVLTLQVPRAAPFLLTMRFAQLGAAFWPPESPNPPDSFGYPWWTAVSGERFTDAPWQGAVVLVAVAVAAAWLAVASARRWDIVWREA
jgi:hypothetical protein